jgi:hypothetical protein
MPIDPRLPPLPFGPVGPVDPQASKPEVMSEPAAHQQGKGEPSAQLSGDEGAPRQDYASGVDRFYRALWSGADIPRLRSLASALDRGLEDSLLRGVVSAQDALVLKADLLDVLEPSRARRNEVLVQWRERHVDALAGPAAAGGGRTAADRIREAGVIAAWQALPPEDRDAGELEERLQALRRGRR